MNKRGILIITCALVLSNAMSGLDGTIVNTALPAIIADLHGIQFMGWIIASFLLGTVASTLIWSKLGERFGNKLVYQLSAVIFVVGSLLQGAAPNIAFLVVARVIAGLGNGGTISLPYIIYVELYPKADSRMRALGAATASYSLATIVGPLLGGFLVDALSWHWIFYINLPIGLLSIVLVQIFFHEQRPQWSQTPQRAQAASPSDAAPAAGASLRISRFSQRDATAQGNATSQHPLRTQRPPIDVLGAVLMVIMLVSLLAGIEFIGIIANSVVLGLFALAAVALVAFGFAEKRAQDPIIPSRLFTNFPLVIDLVLFALIWGSFIAFLTYAPMWAQGLLGVTALVGGATQIPAAFTNFASAETVPLFRRRFSPHQVITGSVISLLVTFALMAAMDVHAPYWLLLVASAFEGLGNGAAFSELQVKVQFDAKPADVPVATSFSFLVRMLSQTLTTAIFGMMMNHALAAGVAANPQVTMNMMNNLSDSNSVGRLPQALLPAMRAILHGGLHNIMLVSLGLTAAALLLNLAAQRFARPRVRR